MADSTLAVTFTRTDQRDPLVEIAALMEDVDDLQGPGRRMIPMGNGSTEYTLWTSVYDGSGSAFTVNTFERMVFAVDPEGTLEDEDTGVWVKLYYTAEAGGSSTATGTLHYVTRKTPLVLPSQTGATISGGRQITKIVAINDNAAIDVPTLLVVE